MANRTAPAEHQPRRRIIDAALRLTSRNGYDSVQVRTLSELAGVSSRTIYEQFPSLDSVIIVAVSEEYQNLFEHLTRSSPRGASAIARVDEVLSQYAERMTANRALTLALLRAFLSGKPDATEHMQRFNATLERLLAMAINPNGPNVRERGIAQALASVCFGALISWATGAGSEIHRLVYEVADAMLATAIAALRARIAFR
jgi:AcrR family transcriptional regulator